MMGIEAGDGILSIEVADNTVSIYYCRTETRL